MLDKTWGQGQLLRHMQTAGVEISEVIAPFKLDGRRRGRYDAESAVYHSLC